MAVSPQHADLAWGRFIPDSSASLWQYEGTRPANETRVDGILPRAKSLVFRWKINPPPQNSAVYQRQLAEMFTSKTTILIFFSTCERPKNTDFTAKK